VPVKAGVRGTEATPPNVNQDQQEQEDDNISSIVVRSFEL
jgi:hypothetical protein